LKIDDLNADLAKHPIVSTSPNHSLLEIDDSKFVAPKEILHMYQKMSMVSFKIWTCLISDVVNNKNYTTEPTNLPVSQIWGTLGSRLSFSRLEDRLRELQTTLISKDEYLPQVQEFERVTFQALGETRVTIDKNNDATSLEYQMMKGLMALLRNTDKEQFIIEMNVFRSLKGDDGSKAAKNLLLFATPYVSCGQTPPINYIDLKAFMDLSDCYINADGTHNTKEFNRKVLKKAIQQVNDNPFISFTIDRIEPVREGNKYTGCYFMLTERKVLLPSFSASDIDLSTPLKPKRVHTILENYWRERIVNPNLAFKRDVLEDLLSRFHLVDKYIQKYIDQSDYAKQPGLGTYQILCVVTAIFQLWFEGHFKKEGSKIYKYVITVFSKPNNEQIKSLVHRYMDSTRISINKTLDEKQRLTYKRKSLECAKRVLRALNKYKRDRYDLAIAYLDDDGVALKDVEFRQSVVKGSIKSAWVVKGLSEKPDHLPIADVLARNSLDYYKEWIVSQCVNEGVIIDKSVDDFIESFPDILRDITFLKLDTTTHFHFFDVAVSDMAKQFK
jgi:hypothetical protein